MAGTVKDGNVTWGFPVPAREGSPAITATFTGTVAPSGDAIEGTWHLVGVAGGDLEGKFSATRKSGQEPFSDFSEDHVADASLDVRYVIALQA